MLPQLYDFCSYFELWNKKIRDPRVYMALSRSKLGDGREVAKRWWMKPSPCAVPQWWSPTGAPQLHQVCWWKIFLSVLCTWEQSLWWDGLCCCVPALSPEQRSVATGTSTPVSPVTAAAVTDVPILHPGPWNGSCVTSALWFPNTGKSWCNKQGDLNIKKVGEWNRFSIGIWGWISRRCVGLGELVARTLTGPGAQLWASAASVLLSFVKFRGHDNMHPGHGMSIQSAL